MGKKPRTKMPIEQRAKQFMPFAALKGLEEALAEKEKLSVSRIALSDDMAEELNQKLLKIEKGMMVSMTYYNNHEYIHEVGIVAKLDLVNKIIEVNDKQILLSDIYTIDCPEHV